MSFKNKIKGWLNLSVSPEHLLRRYHETQDKKYIEQLINQFNVTLYHYLLSLSDKPTAEDAIQTMWYKVLKSTSGSQTYSNVKSWLFVIARNCLMDELRKQAKWHHSELFDESVMPTPPLVENIERQNQLEVFNVAIESLPFLQREAFIFQREGFSVAEISQLTDASFETVKSRIRYAKQHLKLTLEAYNEAG